jgi:hypothetical protein
VPPLPVPSPPAIAGREGDGERWVSAMVGCGFRGALAEKVRARRLHRRPLESRPTGLHYFVEWLARVWSGEGGLVAKVPQDRMQSRRKHKTDQTGRRASGDVKRSSKFKAGCTGGRSGNRSYRSDRTNRAYANIELLLERRFGLHGLKIIQQHGRR